MSMQCGRCGREIPVGAQFCSACGAPVPPPHTGGVPFGAAAGPAQAGSEYGAGYGAQFSGNYGPGSGPGYGASYGPGYGAGTPGAGGWVAPGLAKDAAQRLRLQQNLQPLGITWILWGLYRLFMGAVAGATVRALAHRNGWFMGDADFSPLFGSFVVPAIVTTTLLMSGLSILCGCGLLARRPWARVLGIVLGILALFKIPLGTALGIYTLWVLAPRAAGLEYAAMAESGSLRAGLPPQPPPTPGQAGL